MVNLVLLLLLPVVVVIAIDGVLKCALPEALYRRCRFPKSYSSSSTTGEIVISSMSIAAISWSDDQNGSSSAGCSKGWYQSIDRIRSLESAKDFNYWPEASSKWTFDLLLSLSEAAGKGDGGGATATALGRVIAEPGDEEMAFLLNPYNLRSRSVHLVASEGERDEG